MRYGFKAAVLCSEIRRKFGFYRGGGGNSPESRYRHVSAIRQNFGSGVFSDSLATSATAVYRLRKIFLSISAAASRLSLVTTAGMEGSLPGAFFPPTPPLLSEVLGAAAEMR